MGSCGCGDGFGDFHFPGPGGTVYTLQVYRGCPDCETPLGVFLSRYKPEGAASLEWEEALESPPAPWNDRNEVPVAILDPEALRKVLCEYLGADLGLNREDLEITLEDAFRECLPKALQATREKWNKT